jgi:hypothetical protein
MRDRIRAAGVLLALVAPLAWPDPAAAQAGWEGDLTAEIELTEGCKVSYLSHVVERAVEGRQVVMAKAHCEDGRVFDVLRPDAFEPFQFNECQPEAGRSC